MASQPDTSPPLLCLLSPSPLSPVLSSFTLHSVSSKQEHNELVVSEMMRRGDYHCQTIKEQHTTHTAGQRQEHTPTDKYMQQQHAQSQTKMNFCPCREVCLLNLRHKHIQIYSQWRYTISNLDLKSCQKLFFFLLCSPHSFLTLSIHLSFWSLPLPPWGSEFLSLPRLLFSPLPLSQPRPHSFQKVVRAEMGFLLHKTADV